LGAETNMTQRAAPGTVEWFKFERLHLIEFAKAIDSFATARRSFQKLIDLGPDGDSDVRAAVHTAGVICYARPFVKNVLADGTLGMFSKNVVKRHANYVEGIHKELLDLRQKLVAHSDRDYVDGRLFAKLLALNIEQETTESLVGATVVTQTVHTLHDIALTRKFLSHIEGVEQAAYAEAGKRLESFVRTGQSFPQEFAAARTPGGRPRIKTQQFELPPDKPVTVPLDVLNPHAVLDFLPLKLGPAGYVFRAFSFQVDLSGEIPRTTDNGSSNVVIRWDWP
jgi:hypothetical protein